MRHKYLSTTECWWSSSAPRGIGRPPGGAEDLLFSKEQDSFVVVNGRVGLTNIADRFAIEGWVNNLFDVGYTQVAFNTPFVAPQQTFSAFLAEPRTYGITVRGKF